MKRAFDSLESQPWCLEDCVQHWYVIRRKSVRELIYFHFHNFYFQTHASKTEEFLSDKTIDQDIFQASLKVLDQELNPEDVLLNPDVHYLKTVAQGLFYKVVTLNI